MGGLHVVVFLEGWEMGGWCREGGRLAGWLAADCWLLAAGCREATGWLLFNWLAGWLARSPRPRASGSIPSPLHPRRAGE